MKITLKSHGASTLGGRKVWFDKDINRLNYDERGEYLGEFQTNDKVLVVLDNGEFYTTDFDANNHYEDNILRIEKFDADKVWTAVLFDADQNNYPYVKRFSFELKTIRQNYLGDNPASQLVLLTDTVYPRLEVTFGGADAFRDPLIVDVETFIGVKSFKARGKRLTTYTVQAVKELEPLKFPEEKDTNDVDATTDDTADSEEKTDNSPKDLFGNPLKEEQ